MKDWSHNLRNRFASKLFDLTGLRLLSRQTLRSSAQLYCVLALMLLLTWGLVDDSHVRAAGFIEAAGCDNANTDPACTAVAAPADGGHAIYVRDSGTFDEDGVVWPVFEDLEARYAAANQEFTVEYWFKLSPGYNSNGKELFDHHIPSEEGFWTAFQDGQLWAGIDTEPNNDNTAIHLQTGYGSNFNDGQWHHYALVRDLNASPDRLCLYLDGAGYCYENGSEPQWASVSSDIRPSNNRDGDTSNNYPLYVIGSRTSGGGSIEAWIDELRISDVARYRANFAVPTEPFFLDAYTVMLFHFDEGSGNTTYGYDSNSNPIEGTLVKDVGWYGRGATPLDPGEDATWLSEMWVSGRFDPSSPTPSLTLVSPDGGELWRTDSEYTIRWSSTGNITNVSLSYSTDGFVAISHSIVASTPNTGSYVWRTPVTPSRTVRVRVADADNPDIYDDSDRDFILTDTIHYVYLPMILKQEW
jgi:hypothetical protein